MSDQGSERFGEEYFPTDFRDARGSRYDIHVTVAVASEISRRHGLTLQDLTQAHGLPFHVLLDVAELGTRHSAKAKNVKRGETPETFLERLGDAGAMEAAQAAGNALLGFSLRGNRELTPEERRAVADRLLEQGRSVQATLTETLRKMAGTGETSGALPESPESTQED